MAACVTQRLGPQLAKIASTTRSFHCSTVDCAGGPWRVRQGLPINPSQYGPMTDLPDWSFADGRPAPPMKGYLRRQEKNAELAVDSLSLPGLSHRFVMNVAEETSHAHHFKLFGGKVRRVAMISAEVDRGIEKWEAQQREKELQAQEKRHNRLQPKGNLFSETPK